MPLFKSIEAELNQVQSRLEDLMHSGDLLLEPCLKELSRRSGKMLRPALVLLFGKMLTQIEPAHIKLAAVVELVHTASLLHDDVIDQAAMRRNRPTANALWGNTAAVLLGDFLLSRAFSLMTEDVPQGANALLCASAEKLCIGELKQNLLRGRMDLRERDYFDIVEGKTAALFSCSCMLGAMASKASESQLKAAGAYGEHLGIAFQIMDDIADIRSTSETAGKTLGTDLLHEKLTLPVIHWINENGLPSKERADKLGALGISELRKVLEDSGSIDYAFNEAQKHSAMAVAQLEAFSDSDGRTSLTNIAQHILLS